MAHTTTASKRGQSAQTDDAERTPDGAIRIPSKEWRNRIGEMLDRAGDGTERYVLNRWGRDRVAVIGMRDYERFLAFEQQEANGAKRR